MDFTFEGMGRVEDLGISEKTLVWTVMAVIVPLVTVVLSYIGQVIECRNMSCSLQQARGPKDSRDSGVAPHQPCTVESNSSLGNAPLPKAAALAQIIMVAMWSILCKSSVKIKSFPDLQVISNARQKERLGVEVPPSP